MATGVPSWAERSVAPKLDASEPILSFQAFKDGPLAKLGLVETSGRAFVAFKSLNRTDAFELSVARSGAIRLSTELMCTSCGTAFQVRTPPGVASAHCVACGTQLLGPAKATATRPVKAPTARAPKPKAPKAKVVRAGPAAGPGEPKKRRRRGPGEL